MNKGRGQDTQSTLSIINDGVVEDLKIGQNSTSEETVGEIKKDSEYTVYTGLDDM